MADVIFDRKELQSFHNGKGLHDRYKNCEDMGFLPVPLLIDYIEKRKKDRNIMPSELKGLVDKVLDSEINLIELSGKGLLAALGDGDFVGKYVNKVGNPFEFSCAAATYEIDGWWDRDELIESLCKIPWE